MRDVCVLIPSSCTFSCQLTVVKCLRSYLRLGNLKHSWRKKQASSRSRSGSTCSAESGDKSRPGGLSSSDLLVGKIDPVDLRFSRATVVENRESSADGSVRTLTLSVEDHVNFMDGRKIKHVQENPRWIDAYQVPGQFLAVKYCSPGGDIEDVSTVTLAQHLRAIASSPYEARQSSAMLDASIVELLVSRDGDKDDKALADLGPGCLIEVSNVLGNGYASLFDSQNNLSLLLEECKSLIMVGKGFRGIAPLHAAITWTPVQAHATANKVALYYLTDSQTSAAYLVEWDEWREAGVNVHPIYTASDNNWASGSTKSEVLLEQALFHGEHGLRGVLGCDPKDAAVLISGLPGDVAAQLTKKLTHAGVAGERILFCEYI